MDTKLIPADPLQRAYCAVEGLSVGDAYGNHHGHNARKRTAGTWQFSDDTLMALSIVSNLRRHGYIEQDELAQSFALRREGGRGYGQGVTRLLKAIQNGGCWQTLAATMFEGHGSYGNGAAMRVAPLGAYFADDLAQAAEQARRSAVVTHAHLEAVAGAIAVAVAAALAYHCRAAGAAHTTEGYLQKVAAFVPESEVRRKIEKAIELRPTTSVIEAASILGNGRPSIAQQTVPFAVWAAAKFLNGYETAITRTAGARGDVDTNCAIVGGIVVMSTGLEGVPRDWRERREPLPDWPFRDERPS